MGLDEVLIITDELDENLFLSVAQPAQRAGARGAPRRPGEPGALRARAAHQGGGEAPRGGAGMNQERLMKVIARAGDLGEEHAGRREAQPGRVRGPAATRPSPRSRPPSSCCSRTRRSQVGAVNVVNVKGKEKRFGRFMGRRKRMEEGLREPQGDGQKSTSWNGVADMALVKIKPTSAGRRSMVKVVNADLHKGDAARAAGRERSPSAPAATTTATSPRATRAAATSSTTASSTSVATRTASRRRSSGSSTTRTAAPTSRCCCYADGERRYIIAPKGVAVGPAAR